MREDYGVAAVAAKGLIPWLLRKNGGGFAFQNFRDVARMVKVAGAGVYWYGVAGDSERIEVLLRLLQRRERDGGASRSRNYRRCRVRCRSVLVKLNGINGGFHG